MILSSLLLLAAIAQTAREVAITIDDLPRGGDLQTTAAADRAMTVRLLAPFGKDHIPLTGFVNACHHPDEVRSLLALWVDAGADLGNHTCSHVDLSSTSTADFEADIMKGEPAVSAALARKPVYFRYPYLHEGLTAETKAAIQKFLTEHHYVNAPVTLDDTDYLYARVYAKAQARGDEESARRVVDEYLPYMDSIFAFFEARSIEVTGHEVRQILLIHASQLNADTMPDLLALMRRRGYSFISLTRALEDPAYRLPDEYAGPGGFSWIHHWSMAKHMKGKGEPDESEWIRKAAE